MAGKIPPKIPELLPTKIFQQAVHDCPHCGAELSHSPPHCHRCHCHLGGLDSLLGSEGPALRRIMDHARLLSVLEGAVDKAISRIEKKFPQITLLFCSAECPHSIQIPTLGWWLLNRGSHEENPEWTGLLLADPKQAQLTFQCGYQLETFLPRTKLESLLGECGDWFTAGAPAEGVENFFLGLYSLMKSAHASAIKTLKRASKDLTLKK